MGTTPNNGWPYPESTDFVADGATAIENLADAIDTDFPPSILKVDTVNNRVGINDTTPSYALDVTGDINATTNLYLNGTVLTDMTTYTPTLTNMTASSNEGWYRVDGAMVSVLVRIVVSSVTAQMRISLPVSVPATIRQIGGVGGYVVGYDASLGDPYWGHFLYVSGAVNMSPYNPEEHTIVQQWTTNIPFTWASGDTIVGYFQYATGI